LNTRDCIRLATVLRGGGEGEGIEAELSFVIKVLLIGLLIVLLNVLLIELLLF
jgi:hypothetical protein